MAEETAWLIEWPAQNGVPLRYWAGVEMGDDRSSWSTDLSLAIRFCRESDAHRTAISILGFTGIDQFRFAEHMWMDPAMKMSNAAVEEDVRRMIGALQTADDPVFPIIKRMAAADDSMIVHGLLIELDARLRALQSNGPTEAPAAQRTEEG